MAGAGATPLVKGDTPRPGVDEWVLRAGFWLIPPLFCLTVYWYGLRTWFFQDDFAWLGLHNEVHNFKDLLRAIFTPTQHGTFRPLSERSFFLAFQYLFGFYPLPYRICVYVTQFASLALLGSIMHRLTGSRLAGFLAPIFWTANAALGTTMPWTSAYMQVLCGFFLLLAFHLFLRYVETGKRRYYWWQWAVFLMGFGVMETNLVYPALAAGYALLCSRKHLRSTLPMFIPSVLFVILHMIIAPKLAVGPYSIHLDLSVLKTLAIYWRWAMVPGELPRMFTVRPWEIWGAAAALSVALGGFVLWELRNRRWLAPLFLLWFLALLAPVLPLRDHRISYYLTLPAMGTAMLGAYACACAWRNGLRWRILAALLAALYLLAQAPTAYKVAKWRWGRSMQVKVLVLGVAEARRLHPKETILLAGVEPDLFWQSISDHPFRAMNVSRVYLTPESKQYLHPPPGFDDPSPFILDPGTTVRGLEQGSIVVYQPEPNRLRDITALYKNTTASHFKREEPRLVDAGDPLLADLLGPTWYAIDDTYRWMPKRATVRMGGPRSTREKLYISGACAPVQLKEGPLELRVALDGAPLTPVQINDCGQNFEFTLEPPPEAVGKSVVELELEVSRTIMVPGDVRTLGLIFGVFEFR